MNSARCESCDARVSWQGPITAKPDCPKCGKPPDRAKLAATERRMLAAGAGIDGKPKPHPRGWKGLA